MSYCIKNSEFDPSRHQMVGGPWLGNCADCNFLSSSSSTQGSSSSSSPNGEVLRAGNLFSWGNNTYGQLGDGTINAEQLTPAQIGNDTWLIVECGRPHHSLAISSDGSLFAWWFNYDGNGTNFPYDGIGGVPTEPYSPVRLSMDKWLSVASGVTVGGGVYGHSLAIRQDGKLFAWGNNLSGQLGDGTKEYRSTPVQIGTDSWMVVAAGYDHTCAIRSDGKLFGWGGGWGNGQDLPPGSATAPDVISPVQIGTDTWLRVVCGYSYTLAIRSDGKLFAWGRNDGGQLGDGTFTHRTTPVQISADKWLSVSCGGGSTGGLGTESSTSFAIRDDGSLFAWGNNEFGQLGLGLPAITYYLPTRVGLDNWLMVSAGLYHTLAIRSDGKLFGCGLNVQGQVGNGSPKGTYHRTFVQIGNDEWISVSAGNSHSLGIRNASSSFA